MIIIDNPSHAAAADSSSHQHLSFLHSNSNEKNLLTSIQGRSLDKNILMVSIQSLKDENM